MLRTDNNGVLKTPWEFFSHIYCITMVQREDRRRQASAQFDKVGLADRVNFVTVEPHAVNSEQGIFESHQRCLQRGLADGADIIAVFEDDVIFEGFDIGHLEDCVAFLKNHKGWRIFFWGCLVKRSHRTTFPGVLEIRYRSLAHAYVIRRSFAEQLVNQPWQGVAFDDMLAGLNQGFFAAYPAFAFQSNAATDNTRQWGLDRIRRVCGGLKRIQKANEWAHRHRLVLIGLHGLVIGLLMLGVIRLLD